MAFGVQFVLVLDSDSAIIDGFKPHNHDSFSKYKK